MHPLVRARLIAGAADVDVREIGTVAGPEAGFGNVQREHRSIGLCRCASTGHERALPVLAHRVAAGAIIACIRIFISPPEVGQGVCRGRA
jgi:hypothetical protein